ncbi:MAG: AAA family ATPase, partial [Oscillospiraceae bacterium]|nr:AAA family ATPase [Oscillospiraceae bacterium]
MRLRKLEIQGFKSFPDKTVLTFDTPITAVVGPNGSGKSNIADAIRWVLGEQSTRTLRGGRMEDVIFGGTPGRKALGYAHVQLVIDNTAGRLPERGEEITIARRLYRSGESEYRLNGVMVRLKDIHELFMDTGLGRDGYSIIGQGRIAEIVSAKPAQRREIFEEAAGISRFRYRKEEAERKLLGAEENLVRLRDILGELEGRVEPLREQSEKAAEFLKLSEEKKILEISLWMGSIGSLKEQAAARDDSIYLAKNEYEALEGEGERLSAKIEAGYSLMQSLATEAEGSRAEIKALEARASAADSEIAVLQNDIHHARVGISAIEEEEKTADLSSGEMLIHKARKEEALEERRAELELLKERVAASDLRLAEQRELINKVAGERAELGVRRNAAEEAISEARLKKATSASALRESLSRLSALREAETAQDSNVEELSAAIEECEREIEEQEELISSLE